MRSLLFGILILLSFNSFGQNPDDVLFTIGNDKIQVRDFTYIYEKTNAGNSDYSESSLKDYITLFENFKLKVQAAKDAGMHKNPDYINELQGYKKQLTHSYLFEKKVKETLAVEAYNRKLEDVEFSQILFKVSPTANASEEEAVRLRALDAYNKIKEGADFGRLAYQITEDENTRIVGGNMGYYNALFPDGFYELENAVYNTPIGQVSQPVKTKIGYHVVKVHSKRPARGEMGVSHIYKKKPISSDAQKETMEIMNAIYDELLSTGNFEAAVAIYSEDYNTKAKGGFLGIYGIGQLEKSFEDAAFELKQDGAFTKPIETSSGYHIIKRNSLKTLPSKEDFVNSIMGRIQNTDRDIKYRKELLNSIREHSNYKLNESAYNALIEKILKTDLSENTWKGIEIEQPETIVSLSNEWQQKNITDQEFVNYLKKNSRARINKLRTGNKKEAVQEFFKEFEEENLVQFEEKNLEKINPEFRLLMQEYEEGLLFFEIKKQEIWDKASEDSAGLEKFYLENIDKYNTGKEADVAMIVINSKSKKEQNNVLNHLKKKGTENLEETFNTPNKKLVDISLKNYNSTKTAELPGNMPWEKGATSKLTTNGDNASLIYIVNIVESRPKKLEETRGFVIADYQDVLEKKWIDSLRKKYPIQLNKEVFNSLIKKN